MPDCSLIGDSSNSDSIEASLERFLATGEGLRFLPTGRAKISVVIPARSPAELLFSCLKSLTVSKGASFEVIVVSDGTIDAKTEQLLEAAGDLRVARLASMGSLAGAWNKGAKLAWTDRLLFLKDDVCVHEGTIGAMLRSLESSDEVGAVGSMLIDPSGNLIEAGSGLRADGVCQAYGRGWNPDDYRVQYRREVAYCSGACLGLRKSVFDSLDGFEEAYLDEYYEDVDLCIRLRSRGKKTVYDPECVAIRRREHRYPWGEAVALMEKNRRRFVELRQSELAQARPEIPFNEESFFECASGQRILWIEDAPPFAHMGAGFPRTLEMLRALLELDHSVTLLPTFITTSDFTDVYRDTPREVEVALGVGIEGFEEFWNRRKARYDTVIISRPNNLKSLSHYILSEKKERPELRFIYDAEAVFINREISERRSKGEAITESEERYLLETELGKAKTADAVFAISEGEKNQFKALGFSNVVMLRHHSTIRPTHRSFGERKHILFVGAVHSDAAPNALGLIDFIENALPLIRAELGTGIKLYCAGKYHSNALLEYASDSEVFLGFVEDLDEWYDRCRLFIAPAPFAAGIPLKIIEAASRGIPVVGTELARSQLGWSRNEMLSADTAPAFAKACVEAYSDQKLWLRLREGALARIRDSFNREHIGDALRRALE